MIEKNSEAKELQEIREKLSKEAKKNYENLEFDKTLDQLNIGNKTDTEQNDNIITTSEIINELKESK